eukprot:4605717-Pyramimonas_sp.AAC.1
MTVLEGLQPKAAAAAKGSEPLAVPTARAAVPAGVNLPTGDGVTYNIDVEVLGEDFDENQTAFKGAGGALEGRL